MDGDSSMQHYNLKWNNFKENLLQIFTEQLEKELLTDVVLSCEGKLIKAHRIVLAACSVYFQQLFEVYTVPNPLIILNGVKLDDLRHILTFMYLGEIRVTEDKINDILTLANEFQVKGLSNIVFNNIIERKNAMASQKGNERTENVNCDDKIQEKSQTVNENCNKVHMDTKSNLNSSENLKKSKPPIAFMIFLNEWRRKLSEKYPSENNKELSVRLSTMWKKLSPQQKAKYYNLAKKSENNSTICNLPPAKRRKNSPQSNSEPKQDSNENENSSDGLEIVEEQTELIDITEDDEKSGGLNSNNHVPESSLSNNT